MTDRLQSLVGEIVAEAEARHHKKAVEYWNGLRAVVEWWDDLPPDLQQKVSGREPWAIVKARRLI